MPELTTQLLIILCAIIPIIVIYLLLQRRSKSTITIKGIKWHYKQINNTIHITYLSTPKETISIPTTIKKRPVTHLGPYSIQAPKLRTLKIPNTIISIHPTALTALNALTNFIVHPQNPIYSTQNGLLLSKDLTTLISANNGTITLPSATTKIARNAFSHSPNINSFSVPPTNPAFSSPNGLLLTKDGTELIFAHQGNPIIPPTVKLIRTSSFTHLPIHHLILPPTITTIEPAAFANSAIHHITLPPTITDLPDAAFINSPFLQTITPHITPTSKYTFSSCPSYK